MVYNKSMIDPTVVADVDTFETMLKEKQAEGINGFSLSQESYFMIGHILNTPFAFSGRSKDVYRRLNCR